MKEKTLEEFISNQINNPHTEVGRWADKARKAAPGVSDEDVVQFARKVHGFRIFCTTGMPGDDGFLFDKPVIEYYNKFREQVTPELKGTFASLAATAVKEQSYRFVFFEPDVAVVLDHIYSGFDGKQIEDARL
jgi:hypothetical protein